MSSQQLPKPRIFCLSAEQQQSKQPTSSLFAAPATATTASKPMMLLSNAQAPKFATSSTVPVSPSKSSPSKPKEKLSLGKRAINASSGLASTYHVHQHADGSLYNMVLSNADIISQQNSYYYCQVLEPDVMSKGSKYCVWYKWGRVGTDIGKDKTEVFGSARDAVDFFCEKFLDKTGNKWEDRANFKKMPRAYFPIEVDYSESDDTTESVQEAVNVPETRLDPRVYELVSLLFDTENMKNTMAGLGVDTQKMPLGKLTRRHVLNGYQVLKEVEAHMQSSAPNKEAKLLECSNRFYTLIPHSFSAGRSPPVINNLKILIEKMSMLEALADIEVASSMLKEEGSTNSSNINPVDLKYYKLKTDIEPLAESTPEYELIAKYLSNTTSPGAGYRIVPEAVFKISRQGEQERYAFHRFRQNRQLLWHGSRLTNYIGILSQGLRIAPPEAPITGYMFGKGIYFADMASKSADFCHATPANARGLLLLCETSLGNMLEVTSAKYVEPSELSHLGKHSTKAVGLLEPNPSMAETTEEGVLVPLGTEVRSSATQSDLDHNEFIVYDVAQALQKYLLKVRFDFQAGWKSKDLSWPLPSNK